LSFNLGSLPDALQGFPYNVQVVASGGTGPYAYSIIGGALPPGLTLTTGGQITGVATGGGSFGFTIQVTDSSNPQRSGTRGYTINIPTGAATPTLLPTATLNPALITPTPLPVPTATAVPPQGVVATTVRAVAVRSGPYLGASLITIVRAGGTIDISARSTAEGGVTWYYTTFANGQAGWVSGRNLTLTFDPNILPIQGSVFDQIDNAPNLGIVGTVNATVLNMRVRPSVRTPLVTQLRFGTEVQVIGRTILDPRGQSFWYHIRLADGRVGWVAARFVTVPGSVRGLPVR
jgi:hypothetical protein